MKMVERRKNSWWKYTFEFLSIFIAVISAFALNNWNDNRRDTRAELKILSEISKGLDKDLEDVRLNVSGHQNGIKACNFWRSVFTGESTNADSLSKHYLELTRDFVSIQNTSGYETLKSRGLELIKNDSLRTKIVSLYEYEYQTLLKLEEEYSELQFQENYFMEINNYIAPKFKYNMEGNIVGMDLPLNFSKSERNILLSYLWKIQVNRKFMLQVYDQVERNILQVSAEIENELGQREIK